MLELIISDDDFSSLEKIINKKLDRKKKENNINAKMCACCDCKGKIIGKGKFSTIYEHLKYPNLVIKDSKIYKTIEKHKNNENIEQRIEFLEEHETELIRTEIFSEYSLKYYSENFIKVYEIEHDCIKIKSEREMNNSDDSNDDEYLINQMVLDKVNGECINKYICDICDLEIIFRQLFYIVINLNMNGCFHNDIKAGNIMIEKKEDIESLLLKPINKIKLKEICINKKKKYFPIVKFVDYSLSYNNKTEYNMFVPVEIIDVAKMLKYTLEKNNLSHELHNKSINKIYELCEKIRYRNSILSSYRVNENNINEINNLSNELLIEIKDIFDI